MLKEWLKTLKDSVRLLGAYPPEVRTTRAPLFCHLSNVCQQSRAHRPRNATGATPTARLSADTHTQPPPPTPPCCVGKELNITQGVADVFALLSVFMLQLCAIITLLISCEPVGVTVWREVGVGYCLEVGGGTHRNDLGVAASEREG